MELNFSKGHYDEPKRVAHRLPCTIHADGEAPSARAFCPFPEPLTTFRGHQLESGELKIPSSSTMVFVKRKNEEHKDVEIADGSQNPLEVSFVLENGGYFYQHDDIPDRRSEVPRALQWLSVSAALHTPIQASSQTKNVETQK